MRANFKVMIVLALVCGGGAVWAGGRWLDATSAARLRQIEAERPAVSFATLVVAAEPLRFGAMLDRGAVKEIPWPAGDLPPGAFSSADALFKDGDRAVLFPLEPGEPLLAAKLTGPGERAALSRLISDGNRAVTLRVNDVAGVGGLVLPGDRVDVVLTTAEVAEVILQDVRILSIDQMADEKSTEPVLAHTVTVEASPEASQKLVLAQSVGSLSLVLRRAGEARRRRPADRRRRPHHGAADGERRSHPGYRTIHRPGLRRDGMGAASNRADTKYSVPTRNGGPSRRVPEPAMPPQSSASGPFAAAAPLTSAPAPGEPQ